MKHILLSFLLLASINSFAIVKAQELDIPITVSDNAGGTQQLRFGLDPTATDTIDAVLGESELPPVPPTGVFDARFIGADIGIDIGQGLIKDYRQGSKTTTITQIHELFYQVGSGSEITISWDLPTGVTGLLQDLLGGVVVNQTMSGNDSYTVTNPGGINKLKMTVDYNPVGVKFQTNDNKPDQFALYPNFPNPFNSWTKISYDLHTQLEIQLEIFDILGKHVRTLVSKYQQPSNYSIVWDGRNEIGQTVTSGVYIFQLHAGNLIQSRKMLLLR